MKKNLKRRPPARRRPGPYRPTRYRPVPGCAAGHRLVLVCKPAGSGGPVHPASTLEPCDDCGRVLWVHPRSADIARDRGPRTAFRCPACVAARRDAVLAAMMEDLPWPRR